MGDEFSSRLDGEFSSRLDGEFSSRLDSEFLSRPDNEFPSRPDNEFPFRPTSSSFKKNYFSLPLTVSDQVCEYHYPAPAEKPLNALVLLFG